MIRTIEAVINENGRIQLLEAVSLSSARRALVIILEEKPSFDAPEIGVVSEQSLADWNRPREERSLESLKEEEDWNIIAGENFPLGH
jgi:hypothetical protein